MYVGRISRPPRRRSRCGGRCARLDAVVVLIFAGGMSLTGAPISGRTAVIYVVAIATWKLGFEYWQHRRSGS